MKRKKILVYVSLVTAFVIALTLLPVQTLFALPPPSEILTGGGTHGWDSVSGEHYIKFDVQDGTQNGFMLDVDNYKPPCWDDVTSRFTSVELHNYTGNTPRFTLYSYRRPNPPSNSTPANWGAYRGEWLKWDFVEVWENTSAAFADIVWVKFWYTGKAPPCEVAEPEPVWVRTMPFTCYRVWINENNNFEFIFWYLYKSNNWVRIYDMEGNMVFEVDMPYHDPNLIVDLPDGMYTVKTFNDDPETPLQEFIIGKP